MCGSCFGISRTILQGAFSDIFSIFSRNKVLFETRKQLVRWGFFMLVIDRVAGAALFGWSWSLSRFFGPAPTPTPTLTHRT